MEELLAFAASAVLAAVMDVVVKRLAERYLPSLA